MRIHRPGYRSTGQIESELRLLDSFAGALRDSAVAVPRPVPTRDGALTTRVEDSTCDLLTWLDGRVLKHGRGLGPRSAFLLGEGLGRLHDAAQRLPGDLDLPRLDAGTLLSDASPFRPGRMEDFLAPAAWDLFQEVAERTQRVFDELGRDAEQWGVVHNDYVLVNCHFRRARDGWRLGVLDFDDAGYGYFLYDLAPLLGNLFDWPDAYRRLRRAFLDGYRSVRALPVELERHLPVLMAARHAATLTWLAAKQRRGETDLPIDRHAEIRVAEMRRCLPGGDA